MNKQKVLERLLKNRKINENGCWIWTGAINKPIESHYGRVRFGNKMYYVHRLSMWIHDKLSLRSKLQGNHQCHNTLCFNPDHLKAGTQVDNIKERDERIKRLKSDSRPTDRKV